MKEKWKDEQTRCSEGKGWSEINKTKNYIETWRQGVTNGGLRLNGEDVSATFNSTSFWGCWGFAHNDATNQKEAADEKCQSSTHPLPHSIHSIHSTHSAQLECDSHSKPSLSLPLFQAPSSCRYFWGRESVHMSPPHTLTPPGGREQDEKAGCVTCSQVYTQSPWAYTGEKVP